jgi:hypothetical protein
MIEMVGNFDDGADAFDGDQRAAAFTVAAHILRAFKLEEDAIRFHRELNNNLKTCPGSGIDKAKFLAGVRKAGVAARGAADPPFAREFLIGFEVTRAASATTDLSDATVPEHSAAGEAIDRGARAAVGAAQRRAGYSRDLSRLAAPTAARGEDWSMVRPHVVNLSRGELSEGGAFATTPADLDGIVDAIRDHAAANPALRLLLYAHGGLVSENDALGYAKAMYRWWLSKGVFPVFFVWESSLLEILRQYIVGARDIWDWTTDPAIEAAAKVPGSLVWSGMKDSARRASAADLGEGFPGGAYLFGAKLARLYRERAAQGAATLPLHAIGHSAGAIFHAHLLPTLLAQGVPSIASLSLMAPACRTELFKTALLPAIERKAIAAHHLFTMDDEAERQDNCFNVYHKSLLYLVSESFEGFGKQPLLGLQRSLRKDQALRALYGLDDAGNLAGGGAAELHYSLARDRAENPLTRSITHGGFDNDAKTLSAILRRLLGIADNTGFGEADFPYPPLPRSFDLPPLPAAPAAAPAPVSAGAPAAGGAPVTSGVGGRKMALCIGIDRYRDRPLAGCVNDARTWERTLRGLGFSVQMLLDEQATRQGILDGLRSLMSGARPGDSLVLQYAGHGTRLPDDDDDEDDRHDEAWVPVDYHQGNLFLRDDVVREALTALPAGVALTLFMDCCHSQSNSRLLFDESTVYTGADRPRFLPLSATVLSAHRSFRRSVGLSRVVESSAPGVIHFAACLDHELAWESSGQGDFTGAATAALAAAVGRGDTNESFADAVAREVARKNRQHVRMMPPAAGMSGRSLLSSLSRSTVG